MSKKLKQKYSGKKSKKFWNKVNAIKGAEGNALFFMGCILQEIEIQVLEYLNNVAKDDK